jgi:GntR family transcriptional regulator
MQCVGQGVQCTFFKVHALLWRMLCRVGNVTGMNEDRPTFRAVAGMLRDAIKSGEYPPGSTLPTDVELATRYGSNRATVGKALIDLASDGLVVKNPHQRGTLVSQISEKVVRDGTARYQRSSREEVGADGLPARGAAGAELARLGLISKSETAVYRATPPAHIAHLLGVADTGETVVVRARKMLAATSPTDPGTPTQLADTYIPGDIAFGTVLEQEQTGAGGMISRLAEMGHAQATITEEIDVRSPTPEEAQALTISAEQNVFEILHIAADSTGRIVEVTRHVMPKGIWKLSYSWPLDQA